MTDSQIPGGIVLADKPAGITSFDCIRVLRRQLGIKKIGHAGTLDPMATGLMILLVGSATKQADRFLKLDKSYEAEITLGANSSTGDKEGEISQISQDIPTQGQVEAALKSLTGQITQLPPAYSAIKIGGVAAYKRARRGEKVEIPTRQVEVYSLQLLQYAYPTLKIRTEVSSGTYIRTLAQDLGQKLGTGGYLSQLRRTTIGAFKLADAQPLEEVSLSDLIKPDDIGLQSEA